MIVRDAKEKNLRSPFEAATSTTKKRASILRFIHYILITSLSNNTWYLQLELSAKKRFEQFFLSPGFSPYLGRAIIVQVAILIHEHHISDNLINRIIHSRENITPRI